MIFLLLVVSVSSYLIVDETQKQYPVTYTSHGYIPYGRNITAIMSVQQTLCSPSLDSGVILTKYNKECNLKVQVKHAKNALAIIFVQFEESTSLQKSTQVLLSIDEIYYNQLKTATNRSVTIVFEYLKVQQPLIKYVTYEVNQSSEALKQIQSYNLELTIQPIYYIIQVDDVIEACEYLKDHNVDEDEYYIEITGGKLRCDSQLEQQYITLGDFSGKQSRTQILYEYLRQICISKLQPIDQWIQYRIYFIDYCLKESDSDSINHCSKILLGNLRFNQQLIEDCVNDSFRDDQNQLLEEQLQLSRQVNDHYNRFSRYIWINDVDINGNYSVEQERYFDANASTLFNAICESYLYQKPNICPQSSVDYKQQNNSYHLSTIFVIVIVFTTLLLICHYIRKMYLKFIWERENLKQQLTLLQNQQAKLQSGDQ